MTDQLCIRSAEASDAANLTVLRQQVWISTYATEGIRNEFSEYILAEFTIDTMRSALCDAQRAILVATLDDHVVGYVEIGLNRPCPIGDFAVPEIMTLYVLERFAGQGIGYRLLCEAERWVSDHGYRQVWLDAYHENTRALEFYARQGYRRIGISYFEELLERYENIVFLKDLS